MSNVELLSLPVERNPFARIAELRAEHTELLKRYYEVGQSPQLLEEAGDFISRGRALGALLDRIEERIEAQRILDQWGTVLIKAANDPDEREIETTLEPYAGRDLSDKKSPYVGLRPFEESEHDYFFGRAKVRDRALTILKAHRMVAVLGPSGSGKSSLVRAGVLPALKNGEIPGSETWCYPAPTIPGAEPLTRLLANLRDAAPDANIPMPEAATVQSRPLELVNWVNHAFSGRPLLLVVDQFEEVFTLCADEVSRTAYISVLLTLASQNSVPHHVVLTMRSDFEQCLSTQPALREALEEEKNVLRVTPLSQGDLVAAIELPAQAVGLRFHPEVINALVKDVGNESAALPLLQFTLQALWKERVEIGKSDRITLEDYQAIGGAKGALTRKADEFFEERLLPEERHIARSILLRMVRIGEGLDHTSGRVRRTSLADSTYPKEQVEAVVQKLIESGLVRVTSGVSVEDDHLEVAHEALIRNWETLQKWLQEDRVQLVVRRRLEDKANEWVRLGRGEAGLLDERQLQEAEQWLNSAAALQLGVPEALRGLVTRSRRSRRIWVWGGYTALLAGIILLAVAVFYARYASEAMDQIQKREELLRSADEEIITKSQLLISKDEEIKTKTAQLDQAEADLDRERKELTAASSELEDRRRTLAGERAVHDEELKKMRQELAEARAARAAAEEKLKTVRSTDAAVAKRAEKTLKDKHQAITVEYFPRNDDDNKRVSQVIEELNFKPKQRPAQTHSVPLNALTYGQVDLPTVKLLALKLMEAGISINTIRPLRGVPSKQPLIQIGGYASALNRPPLTSEVVQNFTGSIGEEPIVSAPSGTAPAEISIFLPDESKRARAELLSKELGDARFTIKGIQVMAGNAFIPDTTEVRYFAYPQDKETAEGIVAALRGLGIKDARASYVIPKQDSEKASAFEIWFSKAAPSTLLPRVYVTLGHADAKPAAWLVQKLEATGYKVYLEKTPGDVQGQLQVRYYRQYPDDQIGAQKLIKLLQDLGFRNVAPASNPVQGPNDARPGHFDVVIPSDAFPNAAAEVSVE